MISTYYMSSIVNAITITEELAYVALACAIVVLAFAIPFYIFTLIVNKIEDKREEKKVTPQYFWWDMDENSLKK